MATKRTVPNPLALAVLALLYERPMHPYEMVTTMRERGKHESVKLRYSSLYSVVEALERADLLVPRETERAGRRPARPVYAITEAGRLEFLDWLRELVRVPEKEYPRFMAGLSFLAALPPSEALSLLKERIQLLEDRISRVRGGLAQGRALGVPRLFLIEHEYELTLLETEVAWVHALVKEIEAGTIEGLHLWELFHSWTEPVAVERSGEGGRDELR